MRDWISEAKKAMTASMAPGDNGVKKIDHQVKMRDGETITCRVHEHEKSKGGPLAVIFHGGGWCIGGLENEELLCDRLASELGMVVVNVDYRLAPEHKYPTAAHDCYDALKWAAANHSNLGADPSKGFVVGGTSAGGNLTAVTTLLARDDKLSPPLTGSLLMIPAVCYHAAMPDKFQKDFYSWDQNKNAAILSEKACELFIDNYVPEHKDRKNELFSPLLWKAGHDNLPPQVFQICGMDPLRDEALIYERLLREEKGTKTKVLMYPGLPHGFWSIVPTLEASKKFVDDSVASVQWLLQQS